MTNPVSKRKGSDVANHDSEICVIEPPEAEGLDLSNIRSKEYKDAVTQ